MNTTPILLCTTFILNQGHASLVSKEWLANTIVELRISESESRPGAVVLVVQIVPVVVVVGVLQSFQLRQDVTLSRPSDKLERQQARLIFCISVVYTFQWSIDQFIWPLLWRYNSTSPPSGTFPFTHSLSQCNLSSHFAIWQS